MTNSAQPRFAKSPFHQALGLSLHIEDGVAHIHYDGSRAAGNRSGFIAGGAIAAMIDSAVMQAWHLTFAKSTRLVTLELKVNYLRPAPAGKPLRATATLEHVGRSTAVGVARVYDEDMRVVAVGTVTATRPGSPSV